MVFQAYRLPNKLLHEFSINLTTFPSLCDKPILLQHNSRLYYFPTQNKNIDHFVHRILLDCI